MGKNIVSHKSTKRKHVLTGTPIHASKGNRIGQVNADVFQKDIISKWILNRPFPCIASDIYSLHEAESAGAVYVEFTNTDTGIVYRASIAKFWTLGKHINFVGDQQALGLEHFEHMRDPNIETHTTQQEFTEPTETHEAEVKPLYYRSNAPVGVTFEKGKQLSLFGGE